MQRTETPHAPSPLVPLTFCARRFSISELEMIREVTGECGALSRTEISRTLCELLDWKRPNGRLKNHECRLLLERLRDQGLLTLPSLHPSGCRGVRTVAITDQSNAQPLIQTALADLQPLRLLLVEPCDGALFRQFIQRYHYLGYRTPTGA